MQLLYCASEFNAKVPDAYCVYAPLALASLAEVIGAYEPDFDAKVSILSDCLSGLSHLHDKKQLMHRDINPNNIAIVSFDNPKAVIIDLDSATAEETTTDHYKGTIAYLAPEIVELKGWNGKEQRPPPYGKQVDIWALGLSMFACYFGELFSWAQLLPPEKKSFQTFMVTEELHTKFHQRIDQRGKELNPPEVAKFLLWICVMTHYDPIDRISVSDLLKNVQLFAKDRGKGSIALKSGLKRPREEDATQILATQPLATQPLATQPLATQPAAP